MKHLSGFATVVAGSWLLMGAPAFAKDLDILTRYLVPAYLAQNFAALCGDQNREFLSDLSQSAAAFAEHMKKEITIDLPDGDAAHVQITAANTALHAARQQVRALAGHQQAIPSELLKRWCDQSAKHYIVNVMSAHQEQHVEFLRLVEDAKR